MSPKHRSRIAWLPGLAAAALAAGRPAAAGTPADAAVPAALEVGPGVYMVAGAPGEPETGNLGRIGNAGFIVGPQGVIAIDTGTSYRHGEALLAAIAQVTDRPVRLAVVTHTRQEFLFGALAFRERGIPLAMQTQAAALMASRCENCLKNLRRELGADAMAGTAMWKPDQLLAGDERLEIIGRPVQLHSWGQSSGPGDTALQDVQSNVLFAGGLVDAERIPEIVDSDIAGWKQALRGLGRLGLRRIVPGHGPAAPPSAITATERYLAQLEVRVRGLMRSDVPLSEAPEAATLPDYAAWDGYDTVHRRNASVMFLRLEREQLFR